MSNIHIQKLPPNAVLVISETPSKHWKTLHEHLNRTIPGIKVIFTRKPLEFIVPESPVNSGQPDTIQNSTIAELHKQLRIYEVSNPLPEITDQDIRESKQSFAPLNPGEPQHQAAKTIVTEGKHASDTLSAAGTPAIAMPGLVMLISATELFDEYGAGGLDQIKTSDPTSPTPAPQEEEPLPDITDGLVYPRDRAFLRVLQDNLGRCINSVGGDAPFDEQTRIFNDLRRHARLHGKTDRDLIECIMAWKGIVRPGEATLAAVWQSIKAAAVAEQTADTATTTPQPKAHYWIYGKKGSGKSTLARRIAGDTAIIIPPHTTSAAADRMLRTSKSAIFEEFSESKQHPSTLLAACDGFQNVKGSSENPTDTELPQSTINCIVVVSENPPVDPRLKRRFNVIKIEEKSDPLPLDH